LIAPSTFVKHNSDHRPRKIPATRGKGVKVVTFVKKQAIFAQGDAADTVFYIQKGRVRLTVVSKFGREVTLGILSEGEFFGDGGLAGQPWRMGSANALGDCELLRIDKKAMMLALHRERTFSELYVAYLLARNIRYHEALVDQLFDPCEKRIARALLLLAHFGEDGTTETAIPRVNWETLAEMAGTTRLRVSFFMNRFRRSGFLAVRSNGLQIHRSLLNVVLCD
jgi:CRP/FNR family transcriptional regulator, cyclic AMP receptor protein